MASPLDGDRADVAKAMGIRLLAGLWAVVIVAVFLPLVAVIWIMWFILHILGMLLGDSWAFNGSAGFHLANNLFTWVADNIRVALWGNGGRPYVHWTPGTSFGGDRTP